MPRTVHPSRMTLRNLHHSLENLKSSRNKAYFHQFVGHKPRSFTNSCIPQRGASVFGPVSPFLNTPCLPILQTLDKTCIMETEVTVDNLLTSEI